MILLYIVFLSAMAILRIMTGFKPQVSTSDGAIIMAAGIVAIGAMHQFPLLSEIIGPYFVVFMLSLLSWLVFEYAKDGYDRSFYQRHLSDPIKSFAAGTWIAAISVIINVIAIELPALHNLAEVLFLMNLILAALFFLIVIRNYFHIFQQPALLKKAQGVMLHGCIALQSIAVAGNSLFGGQFPAAASFILIFAGLFFYMLGIASIFSRYRKSSVLADWDITNTIIYGGLSITGLALSLSGLPLADLSAAIWLTAFTFLLTVELLDITYGYRRLKSMGWRKGLFTYHPAQWARNFTLGMFLTFTISLDLSNSFLEAASWADSLQFGVIEIGKFIVILLFMIEAGIAAVALFSNFKFNRSTAEINS